MMSTMRTNSNHRDPEGPDTATRMTQNNNNAVGQQGQHKMTNTWRKQQARKTRTRARTPGGDRNNMANTHGKDDEKTRKARMTTTKEIR